MCDTFMEIGITKITDGKIIRRQDELIGRKVKSYTVKSKM